MSSKASNVTKTFGQSIILDASKTVSGSISSAVLSLTPVPTNVATGSSVLTVAAVKSGVITQTPAANSTLTLPSASLILAAFPQARVGSTLSLSVINLAAATFTTTIASDAGSSMVGTAVIAPLTSGRIRIRFTSVTSGSATYVAYVV